MDGQQSSPTRFGPVVGGLVLIVVAGGVAFWGLQTRARALDVVTKETREMAVPTVAVITPERGAPAQEVVLPGTMQAFIDAPIYARTTGYLKRRTVDIGAHVRAGQLLAEIDTPEIDQQLQQARADLATAEANLGLAETTAARYRDLIRTDSVSQQDLDNANGNEAAKRATVESARANVKRLEQLQAFCRIEAPFDGVITARNTDVGALIDSGNSARELFHIAAMNRLRVFVSVPEAYSRAARPGLTADLVLKEFPGRRFTATLVRTANAIDLASRTLLTEFDVDNSSGELLPGAYAEVHFKLPSAADTFRLPISALMFRSEGLRVAILDGGTRAALVPVTLGRDYGSSVEVVAGLSGSERVIDNPPDSLETGQEVRVAAAGDAHPAGAAR
ncbi:MAG: efflux RND transporter periplasmic adaptor subunit [Betaproteobacteria bacterium]